MKNQTNTVYKAQFSVKTNLYMGHRHDVQVWVVARSIEEATRKARAYAQREFDDPRPRLESVKLDVVIDVF